ncbi:MAG TPA: glutamine-hydrolyzing GMP synthase [Anaerolineales bacterium]|nr:glutamine-hydrolyzing GMP synthase [Anaerolineales bacterium]
MDSLAILDFGSQYSQLIARRIREAHVYCELFPFDAAPEDVLAIHPKGLILSGGPASVYEPGAPRLPDYVSQSGLPVLGICYGMQLMTQALGGRVAGSTEREYGPAEVEVVQANSLLPAGRHRVWMSHGDRIESPPPGFEILATSPNSPVAAMIDRRRGWIGLQFHPEVRHTAIGPAVLEAFARDVCRAAPDWTPASILEDAVARVRSQVGEAGVLAGVSGGVDSMVAAAIVQRAVGDQLTCVFVDTGLMRRGEPQAVAQTVGDYIRARLLAVNAAETFLEALAGITDPELKRRIVGEKFIRVFEEQALRLRSGEARGGQPRFLVQGTIYPDVVESSGPERRKADRIKTHHNVAGLPADMRFALVEPLRYLFKDEVRQVGLALGLPEDQVWRQPFPGPGLAVRCVGEVTAERLERVRCADAIVTEELGRADLLRRATAQAFAVLLPVRSVGVMGDQRTYGETVAVRAVATDDFMTADWARLPEEVLARVSSRIVNEVEGVNRVLFDITSKPPATIEWE